MTHPNHQTNGASLEDCHTNFFALTDLCGIKWRKLLYTEGGQFGGSSEPLDDPVLSSFSKCLAADILCVWRRVQPPQPQPSASMANNPFNLMDPMQAVAMGGGFHQMGQRQPPMMPQTTPNAHQSADSNSSLTLNSSKELWIFWYGEEPDLSNLVASDQLVADNEQGSWESGLSYECRSLLFKALHNLIERCLLSHDFVRLGKWFVQTHSDSEKISDKSSHLSISFQFFVHGESTVCVSTDVRQHPPVRSLTRQHILAAQASASGLQVILAPFGMSGTLTGQTYKTSDIHTRKLIDEWRQFYPINSKYLNRDPNDNQPLPLAVEVIVSGVKMRYPTCFVLATDMDDVGLVAAALTPLLQGVQLSAVGGAIIRATPPDTPCCSAGAAAAAPEPPPPPLETHPAAKPAALHSSPVQQLLADPAIALSLPSRQPLNLSERVWQDNTQSQTHMLASTNGHQGPSEQSEPDLDALFQWDFQEPSKKATCSCSKCKKVNQSNKSGGLNTSNSGLKTKGEKSEKSRGWRGGCANITPYHHRHPQFWENDWLAELEPTPATRASEPTTPAGGPPSYRVNQAMTPGMQQCAGDLPVPSVGSPQSAAPSPLHNPHSQPASVTATDPTMPTLSPHPPSSNQPSGAQPATPLESHEKVTPAATPSDINGPKSVSSVSNQVFSPYPTNSSVEPSKPVDSLGPASASSGHTPSMPTPSSTLNSFLKRPILSSKDYESVLQEDDQLSDLLYDYSTMNAWLNHPVKRFKPTEKVEKTRPFPEAFAPAPQPGAVNPEAGAPPVIKQEVVTGDDDKRLGVAQFDDAAANTKTPVSLFTSRGLEASYSDLEQIFDNSDDTSSDETPQVTTPPGSNKPPGDDHSITLVKPPRGSGGSTIGCGTGMLKVEELTKMYPTPPSLEHNPIASPCGQPDALMLESSEAALVPRNKQEIYHNLGSPTEENIDDWSYVYKPMAMYKMVGSSKYAPLTNLPSQLLAALTPPPKYKPSWQYPIQMQDKPTGPQPNHMPSGPMSGAGPIAMPHRPPSRPVSGISPISPAAAMRSPMGPYGRMEASPMAMAPGVIGAHHRPALPPPYELASPASNPASYLNKSVNSVEPGPLSAAVIAARAPEANSLVVNVLLTDSSLHVFRDHNFDSCTMCVCNAGGKVVGNIRGADYCLPEAGGGMGSSDEDQIRCNCGFSAVVNRRLSHKAGLFYEDEVEITGPLHVDENIDRKRKGLSLVSAAGKCRGNELEFAPSVNGSASKQQPSPTDLSSSILDLVPQLVLELIRDQCVFMKSSVNSLVRTASRRCKPSDSWMWTLNKLEFSDGNEVTLMALDQGRQSAAEAMQICKLNPDEFRIRGGHAPLHRWQYLRAGGPNCNQDIIRIMRNLQPLLQDAVQKKCTTRLWEAPYTVSGPLTWRQFHRLAGRGTDDRCEPQPIPSILVGRDNDWVSLSPYAIQYWENLLLEPYSYTRDVAFIVIAPENDHVLEQTKAFFKELSAIYELCRLGRHCPINKQVRDGILKVGKSAASKLVREPVDEWFSTLSDSSTTSMLKLYAQVCRHYLIPILTNLSLDKTLFNEHTQMKQNIEMPTPSPMPPPSTPESVSQGSTADRQPTTPKADHADGDGYHRDSGNGPSLESHTDDDEMEPPAIVIYIVDPFSFGSEDEDNERLACLGLLRCFSDVLNRAPEHIRAHLNVQIVSLESIVELTTAKREKHIDTIRAQALSVYLQCRRLISHISNVKSLTGFGPAANADLFLKEKDDKNRAPYRIFMPPYVLGQTKDKSESNSERQQEKTSVMYCNYCLSEDQRFLLAACTDEKGAMFETVCINIEIPHRTRRKRSAARRVGLQKLMDFILGIMSRTVQPWRLVVGRVGRIGHGELKGWSWLLSRKSLVKASKHLKEICNQCSLQSQTEIPCILSACLVSMEPDSALRLMPDQFTPDERFSQASVKCSLSTPQDVSATHILVFPTSATTQSSQSAFQEQHINDPELGDEELFSALNDDNVMDGIDGDFGDIFSAWPEPGQGAQSPTGSPKRDSLSQAGSPGVLGGPGQQSPYPCNTNSMSSGGVVLEVQEEVGVVLQQPLALGYYVSTAKTGKMPHWFWASCPHLEDMNPTFLKNALHLHSHSIQNSDDLLQQQNPASEHPLDSSYTTDVLRYVMEGYNALSWLALDHNSKDRLSCLPVHVQVLMQMYHMFSALV
ncbi:Hypothetical predicted protein [Cloeon dipterum]|uniref:Mediator of RNA polymerase II transcription subunit 13 n=1 Tax=Cloeon dipterum TaxID=197152 RepID=A0A8S1CQW9_9INSE|nr:Hypothetical predicted protein [Cloeon dipterum]